MNPHIREGAGQFCARPLSYISPCWTTYACGGRRKRTALSRHRTVGHLQGAQVAMVDCFLRSEKLTIPRVVQHELLGHPSLNLALSPLHLQAPSR